MLDMALLAGEMAAIVDEAVERATRPWIERVTALEMNRTADALTDEARAALLSEWRAHLDTLPRPADGTSVTVDDVRPLVDAAVILAVSALPPPESGTSVEPDDVREMVRQAVDALPRPADGSSVTLDDARPMIVEEVKRAVAALPPAKPGEPADPDITRQMIADAVAALPPAEPGKSVTIADVEPVLADMVGQAVAALPLPKDGVGLAGALIDRVGDLIVTLTDGSTRSLGQVVGRDYDPVVLQCAVADAIAALPPAEPGKPGESVEPAVVKQMVDEAVALIPAPYTGAARGLYDVNIGYRALDVVSFNGCEWRAKIDCPGEMPGPDWMLSAQRGKPGKSFDIKQLPVSVDIIAGYLDARGTAIVLTKANGEEVIIDLSRFDPEATSA